MEAPPSQRLVTHFMAGHRPVSRDSAMPCSPKLRNSPTLAGKSTGMAQATKSHSDWLGMVLLLAWGSSAASASMPLRAGPPPRLACRKISRQRSTPGDLPYQIPVTPSNGPPPKISVIWLPQTLAAASSSLTPGTSLMSSGSRKRR